MSQENFDTFKRGLDAYNRRDLDALTETLEPDVERHPALAVLLGGEQTVFHGHQGVRESIREEDEALTVFQVEISEIRDLGNRVLAIGRVHARGRESGVEIDSAFCALTESKGTKSRDARATSLRTYFDLKEALEAAGLLKRRRRRRMSQARLTRPARSGRLAFPAVAGFADQPASDSPTHLASAQSGSHGGFQCVKGSQVRSGSAPRLDGEMRSTDDGFDHLPLREAPPAPDPGRRAGGRDVFFGRRPKPGVGQELPRQDHERRRGAKGCEAGPQPGNAGRRR